MQNHRPIPEANNFETYLEASEIIDWHTPEVTSFARALTEGLESDVAKATQVHDWVRDNIAHSADAGHETVTCRASEVLRHRTGVCYAKAHLLAAMLRAVGIPAGLCYQLLRYDESSKRMVLHGLNGIYLQSIGRWIRVDPRGDKQGVDAQFSVEREQLAFAVDSSLGECDCKSIFVRPVSSVVACLTKYSTVSELMANLPESFCSVAAEG